MFLLASFNVGSIVGIPVRVHWSAPVGLLIWTSMTWLRFRTRPFAFIVVRLSIELGIIAIVAAVILIHELAHAPAARIWGVRTKGIYLHLFGGMALSTDSSSLNLTPRQEIAVFAAGPASNLLCFVSAVLLDWAFDPRVLARLLLVFAMVSLVTGVFNLIPVWPLDGGQLFRSFLALIRMKSRLSDWITLAVSLLLGVPFAYLAWKSGNYWIFSILLVLMTATVVLLAFYGLGSTTPSAGLQRETDSAAAEHLGVQAVPPLTNIDRQLGDWVEPTLEPGSLGRCLTGAASDSYPSYLTRYPVLLPEENS